jgi:hypothetical protein
MIKLPFDQLFAYAKKIEKLSVEPEEQSEEDVAKQIASEDTPHTQTELVEYAKAKGILPKQLGEILKAGGITGFDAKRYSEVVALVDNK